jgi:hypothetical protein
MAITVTGGYAQTAASEYQYYIALVLTSADIA